ncbi:MAG: NADH:flavin oxidoreductase [Verrucomicrobiales bacterium]|nr:NADH:flavin oxidoreductase [Verrucomicrobiales bacterium]
MCQYSCVDGMASDWHLVHLGSRAVGGAGMVMAEATAVTANGRISPQDLGIWTDEHIAPLAKCAAFIENQGAVPGIQLAHAGRKASTPPPWKRGEALKESEGGWSPIWAPSEVPFSPESIIPASMAPRQIEEVVHAFAEAARRAERAGFKLIEIHAAHGYLLHQFLSPISNQRTDQYGGSFDNRIRFLCQVVQAVRAAWPANLPLWVRISATDWAEGGWDIEESVKLAKVIKSEGVDLIDCSSGGTVPGAKIPVAPGYQVPFAARIRAETGMPTAAVGMITEAKQADGIISRGEADMVLLARQELRDPYWPLHAAKELGAKIDWPLQYQRAFPK